MLALCWPMLMPCWLMLALCWLKLAPGATKNSDQKNISKKPQTAVDSWAFISPLLGHLHPVNTCGGPNQMDLTGLQSQTLSGTCTCISKNRKVWYVLLCSLVLSCDFLCSLVFSCVLLCSLFLLLLLLLLFVVFVVLLVFLVFNAFVMLVMFVVVVFCVCCA